MAITHIAFRTSYCGERHRLSDGAPIEHRCFTIPPALLDREREGRSDWRGPVLDRWLVNRELRDGIAMPRDHKLIDSKFVDLHQAFVAAVARRWEGS